MTRPGMTKRLARLEAIMAEGMLDPTPGELLNARVLGRWRIVVSPIGFTAIRGDLMENGVWTGAEIYTTPLLRLELDQGWVRTFSAIYLLSGAEPGEDVLVDEEMRRAIERNRELIPARPWMFEPPDWSRR